MKRRTVNKVERMQLVDKVCELQRQIDEYERYMGDIFIMLFKEEPQNVIEHVGIWEGKNIWNRIKELIAENKALKENL
jgi:hypothetical protein